MSEGFKDAIESEMIGRAREVLGPDVHIMWTTWSEWPNELRMVLCNGVGTYTSEGFEPEDQVLPLTPYAKHVMDDTIGELARRPWYIEPPPCPRCITASAQEAPPITCPTS